MLIKRTKERECIRRKMNVLAQRRRMISPLRVQQHQLQDQEEEMKERRRRKAVTMRMA